MPVIGGVEGGDGRVLKRKEKVRNGQSKHGMWREEGPRMCLGGASSLIVEAGPRFHSSAQWPKQMEWARLGTGPRGRLTPLAERGLVPRRPVLLHSRSRSEALA